MRKLNINDKVRVRLTDLGREELVRGHEKLFRGRWPYRAPHEDAEGWSEWQLWDLMHRLGHMCSLGSRLPFETVIEIKEES